MPEPQHSGLMASQSSTLLTCKVELNTVEMLCDSNETACESALEMWVTQKQTFSSALRDGYTAQKKTPSAFPVLLSFLVHHLSFLYFLTVIRKKCFLHIQVYKVTTFQRDQHSQNWLRTLLLAWGCSINTSTLTRVHL